MIPLQLPGEGARIAGERGRLSVTVPSSGAISAKPNQPLARPRTTTKLDQALTHRRRVRRPRIALQVAAQIELRTVAVAELKVTQAAVSQRVGIVRRQLEDA